MDDLARSILAHPETVPVHPLVMAEVDGRFFGSQVEILSRAAILEAFKPYVEAELSRGVRLHSMTRHILGLFQGVRGGRIWRRYLSENAGLPGAGLEVLDQALAATQGMATG